MSTSHTLEQVPVVYLVDAYENLILLLHFYFSVFFYFSGGGGGGFERFIFAYNYNIT